MENTEEKKYILGLDISSSCIGYSIMDEDGKLIELNCVKFADKLSLFDKLREFKKNTKHIKEMPIKYIAIEEPLKKFMGKFSSATTIALLNFFNGMISSHLFIEFGIEPVYFNVNNARATAFPGLKVEKDGKTIKHVVWERVMQLEPKIEWKYGPKSRKLLDENYDMSDSYVVSLAFLINLDKQKTTTVQ